MRPTRTYTEKEAARILRMAAQIGEPSSNSHGAEGITLDELARLGGEVGLNPEAIRAAALRIDESGDEIQTRWIGAPPSYEIERIVEGPLDDGQWETLVTELNARFVQSIPGTSTGKTRTWNWKHELGTVHFTARETGRNVRLTLKLHIDDGLAVGMIPTLVCMLGTLGLPWTIESVRPWGALLIGLSGAAAIGLTFRTLVRRWFHHDHRKSHRFMDRLVQALADAQLNDVHLPAEWAPIDTEEQPPLAT